jgi:chemotaxis protein histidine kinase CheA
LTKNETLLDTAWQPYIPQLKVSLKQLKDLINLVEAEAPEPLTEKVRQWSKSVMAKPIRTIVQPIISNCQVTAHGLGKDVRFEVKNGELNVQSEQEEKLAEYLIHLLRNAVIHGIEEERVALGKAHVATISLEFIEWDRGLRILCQDDGKGFNRQELEQRLLQKTAIRIDQLTAMSLTELLDLNSRGGYSSQTTVTLLAGRGVGIEGLFALVRAMGGTVLVESTQGVGSKFTIEVPRLQSRSDIQPPLSNHSNESVA